MPIPTSTHHRVMFSDLAQCQSPELITIQGPEAQHLAKVKRARIGEIVGVLDGRGAMGIGEIAEITGSKQRPMVAIMLDRIEMIAPTTPQIDICCPAPKGDRLERMIDQLTQIGVTSWTPLISDRSERDPKAIRLDRLDRIINEALKQCTRARSLIIHNPVTLDQLFDGAQSELSLSILVCDGQGASSLAASDVGQAARILIGPEGGWSDAERSVFLDAKLPVRRLGVHVLRLESAAVVAGALALAGASSPIPFGDQ